jgi:hypothetical protein
LIDYVRPAEKAGLKELALLPPMASARKVIKDFSEQVMARC